MYTSWVGRQCGQRYTNFEVLSWEILIFLKYEQQVVVVVFLYCPDVQNINRCVVYVCKAVVS